ERGGNSTSGYVSLKRSSSFLDPHPHRLRSSTINSSSALAVRWRTISRGVRPIAKTGATFIAVAISPQPYCRPAHPELLGYLTHSSVLFQCGQRHLFSNIHNRFLLERHRTSSASTFNDVESINLELSGKHQPGTYPTS